MSIEKDFGYMGYQEMITDITMALENAGDIMRRLELGEQAERAMEMSEKVKSHVFSVGILGEFKRGKSTVIDALLGEEIAPTAVRPTSATLNRITYGLKPKATIYYKNGHKREVPVNEIANYVTKLTQEAENLSAQVDQAVVEYPCEFCKNNVEIIDTPGLNENERMDAITESVIPSLDAVVMVLSARSPFSRTEASFIRNKLMTSDISRLIVVVNFIDTLYDEEEQTELLEDMHTRITAEILDKTEHIHGANSAQYQETKNKLAGLILYPVSAKQALVGRTKNRPELVEESGFPAFEERLRKLLTEERGALEIIRVSHVIFEMIVQGQSALEMRRGALEMDAEAFLETKKEAETRIRQMREEKTEEKNRVRQAGKEIKREMAILVEQKYDELEERLCTFVDQYPINLSLLKKEADQKRFQERFSEDLEEEVKEALSEYTEQMNVYLTEKMGEEAIHVKDYVGELAEQLNGIALNIKKNSVTDDALIVGVDGLSNLLAATGFALFSTGSLPFMGLGGLVEGYREAGLKGGVTGFVSGAATSTAVAAALVFGLGSVPYLPFAVITGVAGSLGGKAFTSLVWGKDISERKTKEIRDELKQTIHPTITALKDQKLLEDWAQQQVQTQVDGMIAQLEEETEMIISDTEATLNAIAAEMSSVSQNKEQKLKEYSELAEKLNQVKDKMTPVLEKAKAAVEK
ncbi:MAG: dynamin family protein [Lachnospiraceae bacterium]|nr:dynamin family protein [Lachnospiraceae bacterium]